MPAAALVLSICFAAVPAAAVPAWVAEEAIGFHMAAPGPDLSPESVVWPDRRGPTLREPGGLDPSFDIKPGPDAVIEPIGADGLRRKFDGFGYRLAAVRTGEVPVPRLFVDELPRDMRELDSVDQRKRLFIRTMLPLILRANEAVRQERRFLLRVAEMRRAGTPLTPRAQAALEDLRAAYADPAADLGELLRRVDTVPPSLALAQAAEESGWGTSRYVREGNAVFGQRTFRGTGGLVPLRRERGKRHLVRRFSHVQASVAAYLFNLNTHPAYDRFRDERARRRARGEAPDGRDLVAALNRYSERGGAYVRTIRTIIRGNKLWQFDKARLAAVSKPAPPPFPMDELDSMRWSL